MSEGERDDLAELLARRALTEDAARADAVERRHAAGGRTARENLADLVDPGSFVEYGRYAIAAQRGRRELEDLIDRTPADGLIAGTARVNGDLLRGRARRLRRPLLRLHGAGRDPGRARPPQEGPPLRADRADAAAGRLLRRGRRRAARATPTTRSSPRSTPAPSRSGRSSPGWCRGSPIVAWPLLRRQRGDRRLRRPDRRHRGRLAGDGRPGDDRGRRPRRGRPRRGRADRDAGGNGVVDVVAADEAEATAVTKRLLGYFQGANRAGSRTRPGPVYARRSPSASGAPTTRDRSSRRSPTRARSPSCASASRRRW